MSSAGSYGRGGMELTGDEGWGGLWGATADLTDEILSLKVIY